MKKKLFSAICIAAFSMIGRAQIEIKIDGGSIDYSGSVYEINLDINDPIIQGIGFIHVGFDITNTTGEDKSWRITRKKIIVPPNWFDHIITDYCFPVFNQDVYCTPESLPLVIVNTATKTFATEITPDLITNGSATYRFYLGDCTTFEDSIDVQINTSSVKLNELENDEIVVSPNPANDHITIKSQPSENTFLKIMDLSGNTIYYSKIVSLQDINVSSFENGLYFLQMFDNNKSVVNQKLLVSH